MDPQSHRLSQGVVDAHAGLTDGARSPAPQAESNDKEGCQEKGKEAELLLVLPVELDL